MPRRLLTATLALLAPAALGSCTLIATDRTLSLNFRPTDAAEVDPARLLSTGLVPRDKLVSVEEALEFAPAGSLILACWKRANATSFWGPCSHIARKLSATELAETISPVEGGADLYPLKRLRNRYAIVVIDAGVRPEHLPALRREALRLRGAPYNLSNEPGTYYCSNYQNRLQEALGLREAVPWSPVWKMRLPADALLAPGAKVLYVGARGE